MKEILVIIIVILTLYLVFFKEGFNELIPQSRGQGNYLLHCETRSDYDTYQYPCQKHASTPFRTN